MFTRFSLFWMFCVMLGKLTVWRVASVLIVVRAKFYIWLCFLWCQKRRYHYPAAALHFGCKNRQNGGSDAMSKTFWWNPHLNLPKEDCYIIYSFSTWTMQRNMNKNGLHPLSLKALQTFNIVFVHLHFVKHKFLLPMTNPGSAGEFSLGRAIQYHSS